MRESFVALLTIIRLIERNEVEVRLTKEFSRNHPVFPMSLPKPYHQEGEDRLPSRNKIPIPQYIVEVGVSPDPVKKIIKARKLRINPKDHRKYHADLELLGGMRSLVNEENFLEGGYVSLCVKTRAKA
ncbi:hypothetical protein O181_131830 [Austropuccinia psidii MF-1]|uniref:Uncharacterized protein n=1 Tax=Austropuccinia psidii MF-1 TaxID=1389203 RepID=A0A9Q3QCB9_9BASI|nr:hypothetical protein [Austropuccinia psidii MF-1]